MLRCLHNDLVPVSIKLKSTLRSERAKKNTKNSRKTTSSDQVKVHQ